ncbi:TlpA disulfide reductase family protein [uncultured Brevundimonas sp.]|uniref:TlpA disulfide reductase family protein n=1 Tax=uncultured Brevundimonas sp. TaxID=213418 RepID=UPI00263198C9|nr:TlpA disulfide reductase family protein [uncultured Brevundimonas sp.]
MGAIVIGPLVLSAERFAIILGMAAFLIVAGVLASRVSGRFNPWSTAVALGGLAAARLAHVIGHWSYFEGDPLRILAVWQGGFIWPWALVAVALASPLILRERRLMAYGLVPVIAAVFVWNVAYQLTARTDARPMPDLALARLDGAPLDLARGDGRPTVINVWATWCPPCRREMPVLAAAEAAHPDIRFLFVNQGEGQQTIARFLDAQGLRLDNVLLDPSMALPRHYGTAGIPVTLFIGADGALRKTHMGEISPEQIDAELRAIAR